MNTHYNRRVFERFTYEAPVEIDSGGQYTAATVKDTPSIFTGRLVNYSRGGMYIESSISVDPGSIILINMRYARSGQMVGKVKQYRAKVRWCRKREGDTSHFYGIGAMYDVSSREAVFGFSRVENTMDIFGAYTRKTIRPYM